MTLVQRVITISRSRSFGWPENLLGILKLIDRNANLEFVAAPALAPPEVEIDLAQQQAMEAEMNAAMAAPLPAEDDDDL
jgi:GTP-binding nuclear protein Ran